MFTRALEALAIGCPDLLLAISLPHWYERYGKGKKYIQIQDLHLTREDQILVFRGEMAWGKTCVRAVHVLASIDTRVREGLRTERWWKQKREMPTCLIEKSR